MSGAIEALVPAPADRAAVLERLVERFAARAGAHDRDATFPHENVADLAEAGFFRLTVPRDLGGDGATAHEAARVVERIGAGCAATALVFAMHVIIHGVLAALRPWPREVHLRLVRDALAGRGLINYLRVEPELGTTARGGLPATTAHRVEGGWRLRGHKIFSTGIPGLHWLAVLCRTDEEPVRTATLLVARDSLGIRVVETWDHMGMRATASHDVIFEDVFVPDELAVDVKDPSVGGPPHPVHLAWNNLVLTALYLGVGKAGRDWLGRYLATRTPANLGKPLASLPRMQEAFGEIEALLFAADAAVTAARDAPERGGADAARETALAKYTVTTNVLKALELGLGLVGNGGLTRAHPLERHYRDALCSRIHTPQNDMILGEAGRTALARLAP